MSRPQIRPTIFIALQNGLAALLFVVLLAAEVVRRLLYQYPGSELLWRLSAMANHTVMPVLRAAEIVLPTPDKLFYGLVAGVAIALIAWLTRYWFATAVAGHVTLGALILITYSMFRRGNLALATSDLPDALSNVPPGIPGVLLLALTLFVFVMCIADHIAFLRHLIDLKRRLAHRREHRQG